MLTIQFEAKIWKQGKSALITIPSEIVQLYGLTDENYLDISAKIIEKDKIKELQEIKRLKTIYPNEAQGYILHGNEKVAVFDLVLYRNTTSWVGALGPNDSFDKLPKVETTNGIIVKGRLLPTISEKDEYKAEKAYPLDGRYLFWNDELHLITSTGERIILKHIDIETSINVNENKLEKIEFSSHAR